MTAKQLLLPFETELLKRLGIIDEIGNYHSVSMSNALIHSSEDGTLTALYVINLHTSGEHGDEKVIDQIGEKFLELQDNPEWIIPIFGVQKIDFPNLEDQGISSHTPMIYAGKGWYITCMFTEWGSIYITITFTNILF